MHTQQLTLSKEKFVVVHIGNTKKCTLKCPKLKVHSEPMEEKECKKYLGNFISSKGGVSETIEDRRKKGWGKISTIIGILEDVDMKANRLEAGLLLRQSILVNSLLYSSEALSGVTNTQLARIEAIDSALLCKLTGGHTKCASEFNHLETGTWKLRHILSYHRLIYHHNILSRGGKETINKIYRKQKSNSVKGDWIKLLEKDFDFIGIQMNEEQIINTPKDAYKKEMSKWQYMKTEKFNHI